jgi:hypothetical protein
MHTYTYSQGHQTQCFNRFSSIFRSLAVSSNTSRLATYCMCACMYVSMYVCMYECMHACMHACMYVCIHLSSGAWLFLRIPCDWQPIVCMHVCMYACMYVCMYVFICLQELGCFFEYLATRYRRGQNMNIECACLLGPQLSDLHENFHVDTGKHNLFHMAQMQCF